MSKPAASSPRKIVARLFYAASTHNADISYVTRFSAGDPFIALQIGKKVIGALPTLEVNRAKAEGRFTTVLNLSETLAEMRKRKPDAGIAEVIVKIADDARVSVLAVASDFPAGIVDRLRKLGARVEIAPAPFLPERMVKDAYEIAELKNANAAAVAGFKAVEAILKASVIRKGYIHFEGARLTSERLHAAVNIAALKAGAMNTQGLIAAGGIQGVDCHCAGHGPLRANELIVVDIFPRLNATGYFGDMTRTYLKGKASPAQRDLVSAVKKAHALAMSKTRAGVSAAVAYDAVVEYFESLGYKAGREGEFFTGFFHGLGHGVGLQIHEDPYLGSRGRKQRLRENMTVTIEPGLYYPGVGGCRFEDSTLVTKTGCTPLAKHHYRWEIA